MKKVKADSLEAIAQTWYNDTCYLSSPTQISAHPSYKLMLDRGEEAGIFIIDCFRKRDINWGYFPLLREIYGINPVPDYAAGKVYEMTDYWIEWFDNRKTK